MLELPLLRISQLTELIKETLEGQFPSVTIEGEISNYRPSSTGHSYFTLKDESASIAAVFFKGKARTLTFEPRDGMLVKASGSISVYAQRGTYQIIIETLEQSGEGNILLLLEKRKRLLQAEGLFDAERKKPLPFFPLRVGVISSPTGAAIRDIIQIITRRNPRISIIVLPSSVQGNEAAASLIKNIEIANTHNIADVLIIGRGGGSLEDLLPFSDEALVRALAASHIPTISAVGHEIDWALSDFAADMRAPTPSAAAELVSPLIDDIYRNIASYRETLENQISNRVIHLHTLLKAFSSDSLELRLRSFEQPLLMRFDDTKEFLIAGMQECITRTRGRIQESIHSLEKGNPHAILARGYSMVTNMKSGKIIRSQSDVNSGDILHIRPAQGIINALVE